MNDYPPIQLSERSCLSRVGSLGWLLALACVLGTAGCGTPLPSGPGTAAPSAEMTPGPNGTAQPSDIEGLVVLSGGVLSIGTPAGVLVGLGGPTGQVSGFSAAHGTIVVQTAGPAFAVAEVDQAGAVPTQWRPIEMAASEVGHWLSPPALSPRGDQVAFAAADPGTTESFQVLALDLGSGSRRGQSFDRQSNGPPVWIDATSVLVEVLPVPGGTRFLRLDFPTLSVATVHADGFGPAISADGSLLAVASTDGTITAVPAADWLGGVAPDEGAVVDASGHPFQLAVDGSGRRIAIGYADEAGDPASVAVFVRDGNGWHRTATPVRIKPGTVTMLGWLN